MNVLMISSDSTLAMDKKNIIGDSQKRHSLYGKYLEKLFIVALSGRKKNLKIKKLSENVTVFPICYKNPISYLWDAYRISSKIYKEQKIDVITTQDPLLTGLIGYLLKKKYNIPFNVQLHGDYLNNKFWFRESKLNYLFNILGNFIIKKSDSVRVVSKSLKQKIITQMGIDPKKMFILPVFTDLEQFRPNESLKIDNYKNFRNIVLFVGALSKTKNVSTLLEASQIVVKTHPNILFLIIGDGKEKDNLKNLVSSLKLGKNVVFEGKIPHKNIPIYYNISDLLVLPSKHEGWGLVVIEALACKIPVIVSDACGTSDLVGENGCGFVFPSNKPEILAKKIGLLIDNPNLRKKMGGIGKEYVIENLDLKKNAYKYAEMYKNTIRLARSGK